MDLYFSPISAYSHKALMAFYEKDIPFNPVEVDLTDSHVREEFRQVYRMGKVPCLKVPEGLVPESSNIIEWLDQHYQVNKLIPTKAEEARQVRYLDRIADQYISANAILLFFQSVKPEHLQDGERIATAKRQIETMYIEVEQRLKNRHNQWLVGEHLSMADISLAAGLVVSAGFVTLDGYPRLQAYLQSWQQRQSFVKARAGFDDAVVKMVAALTRK